MNLKDFTGNVIVVNNASDLAAALLAGVKPTSGNPNLPKPPVSNGTVNNDDLLKVLKDLPAQIKAAIGRSSSGNRREYDGIDSYRDYSRKKFVQDEKISEAIASIAKIPGKIDQATGKTVRKTGGLIRGLNDILGEAVSKGSTYKKIHIKQAQELIRSSAYLSKQHQTKLKSIFTEFATSFKDLNDVTQEGANKFADSIEKLSLAAEREADDIEKDRRRKKQLSYNDPFDKENWKRWGKDMSGRGVDTSANFMKGMVAESIGGLAGGVSLHDIYKDAFKNETEYMMKSTRQNLKRYGISNGAGLGQDWIGLGMREYYNQRKDAGNAYSGSGIAVDRLLGGESRLRDMGMGMRGQKKSDITVQQTMRGIARIARIANVEVEGITEEFGTWANQLKLTDTQFQGIRDVVTDVSRLTGLSGNNLIEAVRSSKDMLMIQKYAGNYTERNMENTIKLQAISQKLGGGVGSVISTINAGLSDPQSILTGENPLSFLIQSTLARGGQGGNLRKGQLDKGIATQAMVKQMQNLSNSINGKDVMVQNMMLSNMTGGAIKGKAQLDMIIEGLREGTMSTGDRLKKKEREMLGLDGDNKLIKQNEINDLLIQDAIEKNRIGKDGASFAKAQSIIMDRAKEFGVTKKINTLKQGANANEQADWLRKSNDTIAVAQEAMSNPVQRSSDTLIEIRDMLAGTAPSILSANSALRYSSLAMPLIGGLAGSAVGGGLRHGLSWLGGKLKLPKWAGGAAGGGVPNPKLPGGGAGAAGAAGAGVPNPKLPGGGKVPGKGFKFKGKGKWAAIAGLLAAGGYFGGWFGGGSAAKTEAANGSGLNFGNGMGATDMALDAMIVKDTVQLARTGSMFAKAAPAAGLAGKFMKGIPLLGNVLGAWNGYMGAADAGRGQLEGTILGAITGSADTGSIIGSIFGMGKKGTAGAWNEAFGIGESALGGAATGATLGSFFGPIGTVIGGGIGGAIGGATEFAKVMTKKDSPLQDWFKNSRIASTMGGFMMGGPIGAIMGMNGSGQEWWDWMAGTPKTTAMTTSGNMSAETAMKMGKTSMPVNGENPATALKDVADNTATAVDVNIQMRNLLEMLVRNTTPLDMAEDGMVAANRPLSPNYGNKIIGTRGGSIIRNSSAQSYVS